MDMARTYLDHNATTPLLPVARSAMIDALDLFGNPSSVHAEGRHARNVLDQARARVASMSGADRDDVVFTSGATEALNLVLTPELRLDGAPLDLLLIAGGEHPAVFAGHRFGAAFEIVPLRHDGTLDLDQLAAALERHAGRRVMLALQACNNETGVIQPVCDAARLVHLHGGFVVCDAVQAIGKIKVSLASLGADALVVSAHKFGGPKGIGALCFARSRHHLSEGIIRGGGQERGLRAGTENLAGIAGLGAASAEMPAWIDVLMPRLGRWRDEIERHVRAVAGDAVFFGASAARALNTTCFALPGVDSRMLTMGLDLEGVAVSAGSACSLGKARASQVLVAMGVPADVAGSALRVSLGWTTGAGDIECFATAFSKVVARMRPRRAA